MTYSPALIAHIAGGIVGVFSGFTALVSRKGSPIHRHSGEVFVGSMLIMAATGACVALRSSSWGNVMAGTLTFYLVATGWLTMMRKEKHTGRIELTLLFVGVIAGVSGWSLGLSGAGGRSTTMICFVFGTIALLCAAGDVRMFMRGGLSVTRRLVRHLWRMGFSLFIAAGSFFLGRAGDPVMRRTGLRAQLFPDSVRATGLPAVPVLLIVALILFFLFRVLFTKAYRRTPAPGRGQQPPSSTVGELVKM